VVLFIFSSLISAVAMVSDGNFTVLMDADFRVTYLWFQDALFFSAQRPLDTKPLLFFRLSLWFFLISV